MFEVLAGGFERGAARDLGGSSKDIRCGFEAEFASRMPRSRLVVPLRTMLNDGREVKHHDQYGASHGGSYSGWSIESDTSIPTVTGYPTQVEIVSPIMALDEVKSSLKVVFDLISRYGRTSNDTGLHLTFSLRDINLGPHAERFNYLKFVFLLGEDYWSKVFGRESSTYAKRLLPSIATQLDVKLTELIASKKSVPLAPLITAQDCLDVLDVWNNSGRRSDLLDDQSKSAGYNILSSVLYVVDVKHRSDRYHAVNLEHLNEGTVSNPGKSRIEFRIPGGAGYENKYDKTVQLITYLSHALWASLASNKEYDQYFHAKFTRFILSQQELILAKLRGTLKVPETGVSKRWLPDASLSGDLSGSLLRIRRVGPDGVANTVRGAVRIVRRDGALVKLVASVPLNETKGASDAPKISNADAVSLVSLSPVPFRVSDDDQVNNSWQQALLSNGYVFFTQAPVLAFQTGLRFLQGIRNKEIQGKSAAFMLENGIMPGCWGSLTSMQPPDKNYATELINLARPFLTRKSYATYIALFTGEILPNLDEAQFYSVTYDDPSKGPNKNISLTPAYLLDAMLQFHFYDVASLIAGKQVDVLDTPKLSGFLYEAARNPLLSLSYFPDKIPEKIVSAVYDRFNRYLSPDILKIAADRWGRDVVVEAIQSIVMTSFKNSLGSDWNLSAAKPTSMWTTMVAANLSSEQDLSGVLDRAMEEAAASKEITPESALSLIRESVQRPAGIGPATVYKAVQVLDRAAIQAASSDIASASYIVTALYVLSVLNLPLPHNPELAEALVGDPTFIAAMVAVCGSSASYKNDMYSNLQAVRIPGVSADRFLKSAFDRRDSVLPLVKVALTMIKPPLFVALPAPYKGKVDLVTLLISLPGSPEVALGESALDFELSLRKARLTSGHANRSDSLPAYESLSGEAPPLLDYWVAHGEMSSRRFENMKFTGKYADAKLGRGTSPAKKVAFKYDEAPEDTRQSEGPKAPDASRADALLGIEGVAFEDLSTANYDSDPRAQGVSDRDHDAVQGPRIARFLQEANKDQIVSFIKNKYSKQYWVALSGTPLAFYKNRSRYTNPAIWEALVQLELELRDSAAHDQLQMYVRNFIIQAFAAAMYDGNYQYTKSPLDILSYIMQLGNSATSDYFDFMFAKVDVQKLMPSLSSLLDSWLSCGIPSRGSATYNPSIAFGRDALKFFMLLLKYKVYPGGKKAVAGVLTSRLRTSTAISMYTALLYTKRYPFIDALLLCLGYEGTSKAVGSAPLIMGESYQVQYPWQGVFNV